MNSTIFLVLDPNQNELNERVSLVKTNILKFGFRPMHHSTELQQFTVDTKQILSCLVLYSLRSLIQCLALNIFNAEFVLLAILLEPLHTE